MNRAVGRWYLALFFVTSCALSGLAGMALFQLKAFPYRYVHDAFRAAYAFKERYLEPKNEFIPDLWSPSNGAPKGVVTHDSKQALDGLTLYTSGHAQAAFLIDMEGRLVHEWNLHFRKAWPDGKHIPSPVPANQIYYRRVHLFPNGDLLAMFVGEGDTPWGYGLALMDKDSNPIWTYSGRVHHDFSIGDDGRIHALIHEFESSPIQGIPGVWKPRISPPYLADYVAVLSSDGTELDRIDILAALRDSDYAPGLRFLGSHWDVLHTNAVSIVTPAIARAHPYLKAGQVVVSLRTPSQLAAIDFEERKATWVTHGQWLRQHDPDLLKNGKILLFDNLGYPGPGIRSQVMEFDPLTLEIVWNYVGDSENPLFSRVRSRQQRLSNGNTLITESDPGRLLEVTRDGEIVWEFVNPVRGGEDEKFIPVISDGQRLTRDELLFLDES